jgi:hypothetical protein
MASFLIIYWNNPISNAEDPHASVGTLHAVRYAWLSNFIGEFNFIPTIGQNSFQSILTFISGLIYGPAPFLYLFLWLCSSVFFLNIYIYGILSKIIHNKTGRVLGLIIFMMGQTAFSFTHVLTLDSGSPFLFTGYTDTITGIFSVLVFFKLYSVLNLKNKTNKKIVLIMLLIIFSNFLYAPQNIIFLTASVFLILTLSYIKKNNKIKIGTIGSILLIAFLFMIPLGGMLTPSFFFTELSYSGILQIGSRYEISPGIGFHYGWVGNWEFGLTNLTNFAKNIYTPLLENIEFLNRLPWYLEQIIFTSIRVHFFTIIGLIFLYLYSHNLFLKSYKTEKELEATSLIKSMSIFGIFFFIVGFILIFPISLNDNKWAFTRFLIPAATIGLLGNSIIIGKIIENKRKSFIKLSIITCVLIFSLFGPLLNNALIVINNVTHLYNQDNYKRQFNLLLSYGPQVLSQNCKDIKCKN